jgi:hypothetical protein
VLKQWISTFLVPIFTNSRNKAPLNQAFTGQVIVDIQGAKSRQASKPQTRILTEVEGEFYLRQLFKLSSAFSETDKITFKTLTNNALAILNNSTCIIEKNGGAHDAETYQLLTLNDILSIKISGLNQSINVKITN